MERENFDAAAWLSDDRNIALRIGEDVGMAEWFAPGVYQIHVWFVSRGKQALERARAMLATLQADSLFCEPDAFRRDVNWFCRMIGFEHARFAKRPWGKVNFRVLASGNSAHPETMS